MIAQTFWHAGGRAACAAATVLIGIALSSWPAAAQATYTYTGNTYTFTTGPYASAASPRVTATLQLSAWLPPNLNCAGATKLPGFRLTMGDGVNSSDSHSPTALVSTDSTGRIVVPWTLDVSQGSSQIESFTGCNGPVEDEGDSGSAFGYVLNNPGVWSPPAATQATYLYSGKNFTLVSGALSTSNQITAILQLSAWLPPNTSCIDATKLAGFRLILQDGVVADTLDSQSLGAAGDTILATVSTDATGQITIPWALSLSHSKATLFENLSTQSGATPDSVCGNLEIVGQSDVSDVYNGSNTYGEVDNNPGVWYFQEPLALAKMLLSDIQMGALPDIGHSLSNQLTSISRDINTNAGGVCAELTSFANEVRAQSGKHFTAAQASFILATVAIIESEQGCP